jgi:hypothetical protein
MKFLKTLLQVLLGLLIATIIGLAIVFPGAWLFDKAFPPSSSGTSIECDHFGCREEP